MEYRGRKFIVTGGAGFIGSHMVDALIERGASVTVVDNFSTGFREFAPPRAGLDVVRADLLDADRVRAVFKDHHFVFHFAANADVKDGLLHPRRDVEQNTLATHNVLEAMRANGIKDVAFSSTGALYGDTAVIPTPEDAPFPIQTSLYGASKVACEGLLTAYAYGYGFRVWIYRFVSMLGPRYTHGHVMDFFRKLQADPSRLDVLGDGQQQKSYLHVSDCILAMLAIIEKAKHPDNVHVFNIGHDDWLKVSTSIGIITRTLGVTPEIVFGGGSRGWVGDAPKILLATDRLRALGWAPRHTIEESVVDTLRFLKENPFTLRRS